MTFGWISFFIGFGVCFLLAIIFIKILQKIAMDQINKGFNLDGLHAGGV